MNVDCISISILHGINLLLTARLFLSTPLGSFNVPRREILLRFCEKVLKMWAQCHDVCINATNWLTEFTDSRKKFRNAIKKYRIGTENILLVSQEILTPQS